VSAVAQFSITKWLTFLAHAHFVWCVKALHMVEYRHPRFHPYYPIEVSFMLLSTLFSLPAELSLVDVRLEGEGLTLVLRSNQTTAACPGCAQSSTHVHGHYTRRLADLACQKRPVHVCLEVRRFACATRGCPRTTFAERFPQFARTYARRTLRQSETLTDIAFAQGGKAGAQLAKRMAMPTSRDTLLRLMRRTELPKRKTPRVLGLDDFAWKKGDRYGTLLVDLEARCPVDLLPDREAASVARWLRKHPGVKLMRFDRAGMYAEGAKRGAPRAKQIADRYHLLVNLRDTLKDALARYQDSLPVVEEHGKQADASPEEPVQPSPAAPVPVQARPRQAVGEAGAVSAEMPPLTAAQRRRQVSRANRYARYQQILALAQEGLSQRAIARQLHLSRGCVHRYVTATSFPERALPGKRRSQLDPYLPYLRQRWEQGCHNGRQLAHEIEVQGFRGSASLVRQLIGGWRARLPAPEPGVRGPKRRTPPAQRRVSARQASWWFVTPPEQLTDNQRVLLERVCQTNATLQELYQLGQQFALMVKQRRARRLDPWLWRVSQSASTDLQGFASGIKRDYAAVKMALSVPWSQGQVEGQITRLKLLKRQMYGRARFELLRSRVLRRA
jgi:transposase